MNNAVFEKVMKNVKNHTDIKLVTTDKRRNQLFSEPNYHTTKYFSEDLLAIKMKKTKVQMNEPVYLGMSILEISNALMYEFWYDYIKPKYKKIQNYAKLILTASLFILKPKIFVKMLQMMLKNCLTHQTILKMIKDCFQMA